jgi:hypothetical protein
VDTLFDETPDFDRYDFAARLQALARRGIFIGGSSWKYEGWLGQIYTRSRYQTRGRFSQKLFNDTCLSEYASIFPTVCGDFAFYQFPSDDFWRKLFAQVPAGFQFAFKVPEQITCRIFPSHARYGAQGGRENETFLDADLLREAFLRPLEAFRRGRLRDRLISWTGWTRFWRSFPQGFAIRWRFGIRIFWFRITSRVCAHTGWRMFITPGRRCRSCRSRSRFRIRGPRIFW